MTSSRNNSYGHKSRRFREIDKLLLYFAGCNHKISITGRRDCFFFVEPQERRHMDIARSEVYLAAVSSVLLLQTVQPHQTTVFSLPR